MTRRVCLVGFDEPQATELRERWNRPALILSSPPRLMVRDQELFVEEFRGGMLMPVAQVIYHAIFEQDFDFLTGLALWGGPCLPSARGMLDCRLKLPCLVRACAASVFADPPRGFVSAGLSYDPGGVQRVAKWGNWHCGENKHRLVGPWQAHQPSVVEPFLPGEAVRVVLIGPHAWQVSLAGEDWLKSIHHPEAQLTQIAPDLLEDTQRVAHAFTLELIANDYIVSADGSKHLLEVNHLPNVTRFPEMWEAYREYAAAWVNDEPLAERTPG